MTDYQPHRRKASNSHSVQRPRTIQKSRTRNAGSRAKARKVQQTAQRYQTQREIRPQTRANNYSYSLGDILSNRVVSIALAVVVAIMAIGIIDTVANWGKIYPGVHIGTLDVSGMTFSEAYDAVQDTYDGRLGKACVKICADEDTKTRVERGEDIEDLTESEYVSYEEAYASKRVWEADAKNLQARLDSSGMVSAALEVGRENGGLFTRMGAQTLGYEIDPMLNFNDKALENLAQEIDLAIGNPHQDFGVVVEGGAAYVVEGADGREVNRSWLSSELRQMMLNEAPGSVLVAQIEPAAMKVGKDQAQEAADKINDAIACGATFAFNGTFWNASTYELGELISTRTVQDGDGWKIEPFYDESAATYAILTNLQSNFTDQNLHVEFVDSDGTIMVRTNASGLMPETAEAVQSLTNATLETRPTDTPMIEVRGTQMPSAMSIQAAMDYGIITVISEYETDYTGGATARNNNIHIAADLLNNSIVKANGGEWSFNETAGECDASKGFQGAGSIVNGETVDEIGGGICQVATTVFNAVYEAGYPIDERTNHSLYIASYPEGRDAAINWPDLDLRWHNDTGNDILLQTEWTDTTVTVRLLGVDPGYIVESENGEFEEGAKYKTRTKIDEELPDGVTEIKQWGENGSTITVTRTVKDARGEILRQDTFVSVYDAKDEIIITGSNEASSESDVSPEDE